MNLNKATTIYPAAFLERMRNYFKADFDTFLQSLEEPPITSIRLNPSKRTSAFIEEEPIEWCIEGRYLSERPSFTFDPLFHGGAYYVQESSSMFVESAFLQIANKEAALRVLDMCAAPGGKSTHLLSLMNNKSLLVSNEIIPNRNKTLRENLSKWGYNNCILTQNDSKDFVGLQNYFDVILIDAPCSGEGLFRKDKKAISEWSENNVAICSRRQKEIMNNLLPSLKVGGHIIYSTCTFEPEENEQSVSWFMDEFGLSSVQIENSNSNIVAGNKDGCYSYSFYPHKVKGEGFFLACLKKEKETVNYSETNLSWKKKSFTISTYVPDSIAHFLNQPTDFCSVTANENTYLIKYQFQKDINLLSSFLTIRNTGIFAGTSKGDDFIPSHNLALSLALSTQIPKAELTLEQAIKYLKCETINVATDSNGWNIVTYQNLPLGWIKAIPNRINNYFPKELRILKRNDE